jgi:hypothetical protein
MSRVAMDAASVTARLREVALDTDLTTGTRLDAMIDMSPRAMTARLREVEALRRLCARLAEAGKSNRQSLRRSALGVLGGQLRASRRAVGSLRRGCRLPAVGSASTPPRGPGPGPS